MTQVLSAKQVFARAYTILLAIGIGVLALALIFPEAVPIPFPVVLAGMNALFVWISWNDFKTRRVPNAVTYPLMAAGIVRAMVLRDGIFLLYWVLFFSLWTMRFMGGGDAKLLMGMFGLWPDEHLAVLVAMSVIVTGLPYLAYKYRGKWLAALKRMAWHLLTLQLLPSQEEFERGAVPYAFSFCLAGGVYLLGRVVQ